jgi:Peptidase family M1 domain
MKKILFFVLLSSLANILLAQRFQQRVAYAMNVNFDASANQYTGNQILKYTNNSPDTLYKAFFHLYMNAFQPGSVMDVRSRSIEDPDPRVKDRIQKLSKNEQGFLHCKNIKLDGKNVIAKEEGTILELTLSQPILPNSTVTFTLDFEGQVPLQIRRNGRNNKEGVDFSMAQWYPKLSEYDEQGWHSNPYVAREFYGVWGDFDVNINIDSRYMVAATGYIQNKEGYTCNKNGAERTTWHFIAPNVHDFVWAADTDYKHAELRYDKDLLIHFFYIENDKTRDNWAKLPTAIKATFDYANANFGRYPYQQYSFIQGGDGGMEYPMATMITGERNYNSLVGVAVHELMHSWYQHLLGTNESLYAWMDEGFTSYASERIENDLKTKELLPGLKPEEFFMADTYKGYKNLMESSKVEPSSTHSDHYNTNFAYSMSAYVVGAVFQHQLEYVIGKPAFDRGLLRYYRDWGFHHPNPNDYVRCMEKESGLELDWYKEYMIYTTKTVDYAITKVERESRKETKISLERIGKMPMPLDIVVTFKDGTQETWYIPLDLMRGEKANEHPNAEFNIADKDWQWTDYKYDLIIPARAKNVVKIQIDPSQRLADLNPENNVWMKEDDK